MLKHEGSSRERAPVIAVTRRLITSEGYHRLTREVLKGLKIPGKKHA